MQYPIQLLYNGIYKKSSVERKRLGISFSEYLDKYVSEEEKSREKRKALSQNVSLFDPVLAEVLCRWFTPYKGAHIIDPFAGDTQKGLVFGRCGYKFSGVELRPEQVAINEEKLAGKGLPVRYICDDGRNIRLHIAANTADLLFSCPPYYDLEVYSDDARDASNQGDYKDFLNILRDAFVAGLECLKPDRFAVVVVGDVRDKNGFYRDFISDTKRIFIDAGASLLNELILVEAVGSNAMRAAGAMRGRKLAKCHQNVLCFFKGNPKNIRNVFPEIDFTEDDAKVLLEEDNA